MSKRILYFDWWQAATEFYRLYPLDYIDTHELTIVRSTDPNVTWQLLDTFDVIIISRPSTDASIRVIKLAKQLNKRVIADYDDDVLHIDMHNPMYVTYDNEKANVINSIALCDEIWVATEAIKQSFRLYNKNIYVIPNAHNEYELPLRNKKPCTHNKIATWRGGASHEGDMYEIGTPEKVINMVLANQNWNFHFFGHRFHYLEKRSTDNYVSCSGHPYILEFMKIIQENNGQLFFYPLANTTFNRSKSNCSWLEASYCGSAYFGNTDLPEFKRPGITDLGKLDECITNDDFDYMKQMNEMSWNWIVENQLVSHTNELRIERLLNI